MTTIASSSTVSASSPFDRDRFLFSQKLFSINETYRVFDESNRPILFIQRSGHWAKQILAFLGFLAVAGIGAVATIAITTILTSDVAQAVVAIVGILGSIFGGIAMAIWIMPKRHIEFFVDESKQHLLFRVYQDKKWSWMVSTYTAADADDTLMGWYSKNYLTNIFRKRWKLFDREGNLICYGMEDSWVNAVLRRVLRDYWPMRLNFILLNPTSGRRLGLFNRKFTLLDKYVLDLSEDAQRTLDRRLAVGMGVLLDTAERR